MDNKLLALLTLLLLLVGCSTNEPTQQFTNIQVQIPQPDPWLMEEVRPLAPLPGQPNTPIPDYEALQAVVNNYAACKEARLKAEGLQKFARTLYEINGIP